MLGVMLIRFDYCWQGILPLGFCSIQSIEEVGHMHALQITGPELTVCISTQAW